MQNKIVDKEYCMSSFLTFRYIYDENIIFDRKYPHKKFKFIDDKEKDICDTAKDIDKSIRKSLSKLDLSNVGILLSGGMDSAILASYMPAGTKAYTARCVAPNAIDETARAAQYCRKYNLEHIIVDVSWNDYVNYMDGLMLQDGCPVFANEPQVYSLVRRMKRDGLNTVIFGDNADLVFGGYDKLLSKDWSYNEWIKRYTFLEPEVILNDSLSMDNVYRKFSLNGHEIDYIKFMDEILASSSSAAYINAFEYAEMQYLDPYAYMKMSHPYDLQRIRAGESKYLIRELFRIKYPDIPVPEKIAMARAMDQWLKDWQGPVRSEFKENCIEGLTGEQKFLVYSLERFLNLIENGGI